ncbi:MAG: TetR/AcrR family transcriptional regulator [Bacteroidales bacterium]
MARRIDESKIERIREAALHIISEQGILNCSVAMIAQEAQVSVGYLYRHYPSKDNLIEFLLKNSMELINQRVESLLDSDVDLDGMIRGVVGLIAEAAKDQPSKIKFFIIVFNDFSYSLNAALQDQIRDLTHLVIERYKKSGELKQSTAPIDLFLSLISIPFQYYALHYKSAFEADNTIEELEERIVRMVKASLS